MNIYSLAQQSSALNEIGYAIDTAERIKLQMGLLTLTQLANADQLLFWGKIFTTASPYYIAVAVDFKGHFSFPNKTFYYSTDNFTFKKLPQPDKFYQSKANDFNVMPFTGNPKNVLINVQAQGQEKKQQQAKNQNPDNLDSQDEAVEKIVPENFTEEGRLSYTVRAVQIQCQIVPKGAFRMVVQHEIRYNQKFRASNQVDLYSFVHFRYPQTQTAANNLESSQSIFRDDILDQIQNLTFWSIQQNTQNDLVTVRSFLWPGYLSYLFKSKSTFGGAYFGNGIKNVDLPFYI